MTLIRTLLWVILMAYSLSAVAKGEDTVVSVELKEPRKRERSPDDPINQVRAFVELDTVQRDVSQGIVFIVDIYNDGDERVKLADPTERVSIRLVDDEGYLCNRRSVRKMSIIRTGDPEGTRARLDLRRSYVIEKDRPRVSTPGIKTVHDITDGEIELSPGEQLRMVLRIAKVIANPREHRGNVKRHFKENPGSRPPDPEIGPIAGGTYQLEVLVSLLRKGSTIGKSLDSDKVTVRLGPPSDEPD